MRAVQATIWSMHFKSIITVSKYHSTQRLRIETAYITHYFALGVLKVN